MLGLPHSDVPGQVSMPRDPTEVPSPLPCRKANKLAFALHCSNVLHAVPMFRLQVSVPIAQPSHLQNLD